MEDIYHTRYPLTTDFVSFPKPGKFLISLLDSDIKYGLSGYPSSYSSVLMVISSSKVSLQSQHKKRETLPPEVLSLVS